MKVKKLNNEIVKPKFAWKRSAANYLPKNSKANLGQLKEAAAKCQGCPLYLPATQTVFGDGNARARILFIGEQPGDKEDREGKPFIGPAGQLLDSALEGAGIDKKSAYFTNAVKHFKFEERGKRRLHKKPKTTEIDACRPWLEAEITKVKPDVLVCLGATAVRSILGRTLSITEYRGQFLQSDLAQKVLITVHPSSILRIISSEDRHEAIKLFIKDLKEVAK